jgi:cellulose synthase/poly-beta-1,6-N-acetylglucosamine synthase-like glycosyltransferase
MSNHNPKQLPLSDKRLAVLIPAHNEAEVIAATLKSFSGLVDYRDIFVVDDGSDDATAAVAAAFTPNVLVLNPNQGKANAMNTAIGHFQLSLKYDYIFPMDADTKIDKNFLNHTLPVLNNDYNNEIACVVGKVIGKSHSWVTTFRLWEYEVAQTIHKAAQSRENAIIVCPGCATVYRSRIFSTLPIPSGTLTEDMDFTFQIHRNKLGKIVFAGKALVITQDPKTLSDFIKQIDRWYTGFWQCVRKNNIPWGGQMLDVEVGLLATEAIFNGMLVIALIFLIPFVIFNHPYLLYIPLSVDLLFFLVPTMVLTAIRHRSWKIFAYLPLFYLARFISSLVFLSTYIKVIVGLDTKMVWGKTNRYQVI